jgi:hypothetical protein
MKFWIIRLAIAGAIAWGYLVVSSWITTGYAVINTITDKVESAKAAEQERRALKTSQDRYTRKRESTR